MAERRARPLQRAPSRNLPSSALRRSRQTSFSSERMARCRNKTTPTLCLSDLPSLVLYLAQPHYSKKKKKKAHLCLSVVLPPHTDDCFTLYSHQYGGFQVILNVYHQEDGNTGKKGPLSAHATRHSEHLAQLTSAQSLHCLMGHSGTRPTCNLHKHVDSLKISLALNTALN